MHHYPFHPGDYLLDTSHLTAMEDLAYRRLLDLYYGTESPIPLDTQWVSRKIRMDIKDVEMVLKEFFVEGENGWRQSRCDMVIADYQSIRTRNQSNGKAGGRPKKTHWVSSGLPDDSQSEPTGKLTINHKPKTIHTEASPPAPCVEGTEEPEDDVWQQGIKTKAPDSRPDREPVVNLPPPRQPRGWAPTPEQIQVGSWFRRQPTTVWSDREQKAWKAIRMGPEDMEILDWFYTRSGYQYLRRDLLTLLNNWQGEIDKARSYDPEKETKR